jgi:hypothetical protein
MYFIILIINLRTIVLFSSQQLKMLQSLGLKSTLITDGSSPINLFNTAQGLIGGLVPRRRRDDDDDDSLA